MLVISLKTYDFYTDSNVNIYSYFTTHVATNRDADQAPLMRRLNNFLFEGVLLGAWERLSYSIAALRGPSIILCLLYDLRIFTKP